MKSKIIYIAICLFVAQFVGAQIVTPMGYGLPSTPIKIAEFTDGVAAVCADQNNEVKLHVWNGHFWYTLANPVLPKVGTSADGTFEIVDLIALSNEELILSGQYTQKNSTTAKNVVLKWSNGSWTNISNTLIEDSEELTKLVAVNGKLHCVGKFADTSEYNMAIYENGAWAGVGNTIVKIDNQDKFGSITEDNGTIYSTGSFTSAVGKRSLAVFENSEWKIADNPAFLGENKVTGKYGNNVVVYGESDFNSDKVRMKSGNAWINLTAGLENYEVQDISNFAELDGSLFAIGKFTDLSTSEDIQLLEYNGDEWDKTNLNLSSISLLHSSQDAILVGGDFSDNARINFVGALKKNYGQISARVYLDANSNCIKDDNEQWFGNYPLEIENSFSNLNTDIYGQLYLPVNKGTYKINAGAKDYYQSTCPSREVDVTEYKTYYGAVFGVNKQVGIRDGAVVLTDIQGYNAQKDDAKQALVCVTNPGSQPINDAELTIEHSESIANFRSETTPVSYADNIAKWIINLNADEKQCFYVDYTIADEDNMRLLATFSPNNDIESANNVSALKYKTGSQTANSKHCNNGKVIDANEDMLEYKVSFKNLGPTEVVDMKIVDVFDTDIRLSAKGVVSNTPHNATSLATYWPIDNGNNIQIKIVWSFDDINLPASSFDNSGSESFLDINVNVQPSLMTKGAELCNTAEIFYSYKKGTFDEPITTNTVCSHIGDKVGGLSPVLPNKISGLTISPNPVVHYLNINNETTDSYAIKVTNVLGADLLSVHSQQLSNETIDMSNFDSGVYFIYANDLFVQKIVVK